MGAPALAQNVYPLTNPSRPMWAQGNDPGELGIVDPIAVSTISTEEVVQQILERRNESEKARKHLEIKWRYFEDLYHLRSRNQEKEEWQANTVVPVLFNKVKTARSLYESALMAMPDYFSLVGEGDHYQNQVARELKKWIKISAEIANFKPEFLNAVEEATLLCNSAVKITLEPFMSYRPRIQMQPLYSPDQMQQAQMMGRQTTRPKVIAGPEKRWKICAEYVPLWHLYPDPYSKSFYDSWVVEEYEVDHEKIQELIATGLYHPMPDLGDGVRLQRSEFLSRWQRYELTETRTSTRKRHLITKYTGNLHDRDGNLICKNWVVDLVDEKIVARAGPNPRWLGENGYAWINPMPFPGRVWGRSQCESAAEMQEEQTYLFNLTLDDAKYSVMSAFLLDDTKALEPGDWESIEPGKIYRGMDDFIKKLDFKSQLQHIWPVLGFMDQQVAKTTFVSESIDGQPTSRGRPSAFEIDNKTQASLQHFQNLARGLEDGPMTHCLEMIRNLLLQFGDESGDPRVSSIINNMGGPQALKDQPSRLMLLSVPHKIEVRGLTTMQSRQQLINSYMQAFQIGQGLGVHPLDMVKPWYNMIALLGLTPEQMGLPVEPEQYNTMLQRMQQQAAMQQPNGPAPGPKAPGGQAQPPSPASVQTQAEQPQ